MESQVVGRALDGARWVLVVDDDRTTRELVRESLELEGCRVADAAGLAGARLALNARSYDAALLDLNLGDGSGMELIRAIRAMHGHRTKIVVMSGHHEDVLRRRATSLGADAFVKKPFIPADLIDAIAPVVRAH